MPTKKKSPGTRKKPAAKKSKSPAASLAKTPKKLLKKVSSPSSAKPHPPASEARSNKGKSPVVQAQKKDSKKKPPAPPASKARKEVDLPAAPLKAKAPSPLPSKAPAPKLAARTPPPATKKKRSPEDRKVMELKRELNRLLQKKEETPQIKDAQGRFYCQHETCDQPAVTGRHCRHHYLVLWKYLQTKKNILNEGYLLKSLKSVVNVFGPGGLDFVLRDFKSEKGFEVAAREMSLPLREEDPPPSQKDMDY